MRPESGGVKKKVCLTKSMEAAVVPLMFTITYMLQKKDHVDMDKVVGGMIMTVVVACLGVVSPRLAYVLVLVPAGMYLVGSMYEIARE